jgi:hypothetical protein
MGGKPLEIKGRSLVCEERHLVNSFLKFNITTGVPQVSESCK